MGPAPLVASVRDLKYKRARKKQGSSDNASEHALEEESGHRRQELLTAEEMRKEDRQAESWGDRLTTRQTGTLRVALQNIQRLPVNRRDPKHEDLIQWLEKDGIDIAILTEINTYWPKVKPHQQWEERSEGLFPQGIKSIFGYNKNYAFPGTVQYGGVGLLAMGETRHRLCGRGEDSTGLGRWTWMRYQGRGDCHLRGLIGAYRPNPKGAGDQTVHAQHQKYLLQQKDPRDPLVAFDQDLDKAIKQWSDLGDHIVVALDANDDLRNGTVKRGMARRGLREVLLSKHRDKPTVATFHRNTDGKPIDGIFATRGIKIQAGGYYAFDAEVKSPHRALWVDIDFESAFGTKLSPSNKAEARRLQTKDPRVVKRYTKKLEQELRRLKLPHRLLLLEREIQAGRITQDQATEYESIYAAILKCKNLAERKCRKFHMGWVPWSPEYQEARDMIEVWVLLRKKKLGLKVSSRRIRRWIEKTKITNPWRRSMADIEQALKEARATYYTTKKEATELRKQHNDRLHEALAKQQGLQVDQVKKNMNQIERLRRQARRIRRATNKRKSGGLAQVGVKENGQQKIYLNRLDIERVCGEENLKRFWGSYDRCPFLQEPLLSEFGTLGINANANAVLQGTYSIPDGVPTWMTVYFNALRKPLEVKRRGFISDRVKTSDHRAYWKRAVESKSSEPRGLHNGHFKAGSTSELISQVDAALRHIPYCTGYAPANWCNITDLAIEKQPGNFSVEKMRTIQLMATEFNTNNKQLGRDMMNHAEACQILPEEHGGSRKGKQAVEQVLNKRLALDVTRQTRRAAGLVGTDAASCYDRMAHVPTSISMQRLGVKKGPVASLFRTLQNSIHRICTAFGDSGVRFVSDPGDPIQGIGQGNGVGPAGWIALSSPIMAMLRALGFGFWVLSALTYSLVYTMGFAFVDDTDLFHSGQAGQTGEDLIPEIQSAVNWWEKGISATGGSLVPSKSYWGLIDHHWNPTTAKWTLHSIADTPGEIAIRKVDSEELETLRRIEPTEAVKTLGVMLNMEGTDKEEVEYLREKAEVWAEHIRTGVITKNDGWYALNTTVMKTLEYPMAAICLSKTDWDHVMAPVLEAGLNAMQFSRNFPRLIVYGPKTVQGLGLKDPYIVQGLTWIQTLMRHGDRATVTGQLLRASMENLHLEIGTGAAFFEDDYDVWAPLATDCWLKHVWQFQAEHGIRVEHTVPKLCKQTTADEFLMPLFAAQGYSGNDLRLLNQCRCYLRAVTTADISVADGSTVCNDAWMGSRNASRTSTYEWPRTERPIERHWHLWRKALSKALLSDARTLARPTGKWLPATQSRWLWWYHATSEDLFHQEGAVWTVWRPTGRTGLRCTTRTFSRAAIAPQLPNGIQAVSVSRPTDSQARITGLASFSTPPTTSHIETLDHRLQWLREALPREAWILDELDLVGNPMDVVNSIQAGDASAISDGSFKDLSGAAGFSIVCRKTGSSLTGRHTVQGPACAQSAYRSELSGILGVQKLVQLLTIHYGISTGGITLACDGLSALQQAFFDGPVNPTRPQFDLLQTIRRNFKHSTITWTSRHVRGHQEDTKAWTELTWWEQQNVRMDHAAKDKMRRPYQAPTQHVSEHEGWALWRGNRKHTSFDLTGIYNDLTEQRVIAYWVQRGRLTEFGVDKIAWGVLAKACSIESSGFRRWVTKHVTGVCGVGKWLERWKWQAHSKCPRCDIDNEDHRHVYQCSALSARIEWQGAMDDLRQWCLNHETNPDVIEVMINCLHAWRQGRRLPPYRGRDLLAHAYDAQRAIGWGCFLEGSLASAWVPVQAQHFLLLGYRRTAEVWARGLTRQLWRVAFRMWQHRNGWQQNEANPHNLRRSIALNSQICEAFAQGSSTVRPEHRHLFNQPIEQRLNGSLLGRTNWLEFLSLAQCKARAQRSRHRESKRRFRSWARSGLKSDEPPPRSPKRRKSTHRRKTRSKRSREETQSPPGGNTKRPRLASTSADALWSGSKRKRPPEEVPD